MNADINDRDQHISDAHALKITQFDVSYKDQKAGHRIMWKVHVVKRHVMEAGNKDH